MGPQSAAPYGQKSEDRAVRTEQAETSAAASGARRVNEEEERSIAMFMAPFAQALERRDYGYVVRNFPAPSLPRPQQLLDYGALAQAVLARRVNWFIGDLDRAYLVRAESDGDAPLKYEVIELTSSGKSEWRCRSIGPLSAFRQQGGPLHGVGLR